MAPPAGLVFRIDQTSGRLSYIPDPGPAGGSSGNTASLEDFTLVVTGAPATPEAVAALAYANLGLPLPWSPSARFQVA
jgi:hypothetical protein